MELARPLALLLGLVAVPLLLLSLRRGARSSLPLPSAGAFAALRPSLRLRLARYLPPILRAFAVVLLAVALAGPRVGDANAVVPGQGIDIVLSLDISSSMNTSLANGKQSRLDATKEVMRNFINGRKDDRIGLVVFQRDALPLSPPTLDYKALNGVIDGVRSGLLTDGTGIGVGIGEALNMLRDSSAASRIVILLTDGEHNASNLPPDQAAAVAASLKIKVYTIGFVSKLAPPGRPNTDIDEKLMQSIADRTGAKSFVTDNAQQLASIYDEIGKLEKSSVGREHFERFTELAPWFLGAAAALLAAELLLASTWLRRLPA
jgi:Ca-activated chloride channel family protein